MTNGPADAAAIDAPPADGCADLVAAQDPARFRATMAGPVAARASLWPVYAFNIEAARAPWASREPHLAEMRLQFWVDVADGTLAHPRHEIATPFAALLDRIGAQARARAAEVANARRHDCWPEPFADAAALVAYLDQTGGALMELAALALRTPTGQPAAQARPMGRALALARYLAAVPSLVARGRHPLPDGRPQAIRDLAEQGLSWLGESDPRSLPRAAILPAHAARPLLMRAARNPATVAEGLALSPLSDSFSLMRAALLGRF